jgi:hypothetical protein
VEKGHTPSPSPFACNLTSSFGDPILPIKDLEELEDRCNTGCFNVNADENDKNESSSAMNRKEKFTAILVLSCEKIMRIFCKIVKIVECVKSNSLNPKLLDN